MRTSRKTDFRKLKITLVTMTYHSQHPQFLSLSPHVFLVFLNPTLHGLFEAGSTRGGGGGGRHKVPAAFFSETVKATAIKLGTLTN